MFAYIIRRVMYAVPILIGINLLTFAIFFVVNTPNDMARMHLGMRRITPQAIELWKEQHGYNEPLYYNAAAHGLDKVTHTIFFEKSVSLFAFKFGRSDSGRDIGYDIRQRVWPSLAIQIPVFVIGLATYVTFALLLAFFRRTYIDLSGVVLCVLLMSISALFYVIAGQYLVGKTLRLVPISGYSPGLHAFKFVVLPIAIGIIGGVGGQTRWFRTLFLEEMGKDFVRTARAKGLAEYQVMYRHVLKNGLVPILTGSVAVFPLLFMGSLILESFFGIPGLGSYTIHAIQRQDFAIVRAMVFLGSVMYIIGLILTDICYTLVDPRIRLSSQ